MSERDRDEREREVRKERDGREINVLQGKKKMNNLIKIGVLPRFWK